MSAARPVLPLRPRAPLWRRVLRLAGRQLLHWAENNDDPRFDRNGERWLLGQALRAHAAAEPARPFVLLDAGANRGDYLRAARPLAEAAGVALDLHAFEPSPANVAVLAADPGRPAPRVVAAAVGEQPGHAVLHDGREGSSQASLVARAGHGGADVTVPVIRLDQYLAGAGLARVDLLKLDIEGGELAALRGLGARLDPAVVGLIQFEYGGATLDARASLRELYALLESRGYTVAKLFPRALEARDYRPWMDHFAYANYVALPRRG